jgi:transcription termination/antitermination protein NusG
MPQEAAATHCGWVEQGQYDNWFALRVKSRHEKVVADTLENKGFAHLLPLCRSTRRWSDRTKTLDLPLFPGYVFCRFDLCQRCHILQTLGVRSIVAFGSEPSPATPEDIHSLCTLVAAGAGARPTQYLAAGQRVMITEGPFSGVTGYLMKLRNSRILVISIRLLQRSVAVEIDQASAVPLGPQPAPLLSWHKSPSQRIA